MRIAGNLYDKHLRDTGHMKKLFLSVIFLAFAFASLANASESIAPTAATAPEARIIYLVRHGHYVSDKSINEKIGPGISPIGSAQANLAGARLTGLQIKFDSYYVSPMQRARDTAAVIGKNFPESKFKVTAVRFN